MKRILRLIIDKLVPPPQLPRKWTLKDWVDAHNDKVSAIQARTLNYHRSARRLLDQSHN